jgi:hypothetical protein
MNKDQLDVLRMYQTTYKVLQTNNAIWISIVPFVNSVNALKTLIDELSDLLARQQQDVSGIAADKKHKRKWLEKLSYQIETIIVFYATTTDNKKLLAKVNFNRSDYTLARDNSLIGICSQILNAAIANAAALLPFGLTAGLINSLQTSIDEFNVCMDKPKSARSDAAEATKKIPLKFRRARKLLNEQLDTGMELYRDQNGSFYSKYFKARIIVNTPRLKRALKATFVSASNQLPLAKLKLKIDGKLNKLSSPKGTVYVQHLDEGKHFIEAIMEDGSVRRTDFNIIKGETTTLVVNI